MFSLKLSTTAAKAVWNFQTRAFDLCGWQGVSDWGQGPKVFFIPLLSRYLTKIRWLLSTCCFRFWRRLKFMKVKMHQLLDLHFIFLVATRCPWMSMAWFPLYSMVISGSKGELSDEQLMGGRPVMHLLDWRNSASCEMAFYMVCLRNGLYTNDLIRNGFLTPRVYI